MKIYKARKIAYKKKSYLQAIAQPAKRQARYANFGSSFWANFIKNKTDAKNAVSP